MNFEDIRTTGMELLPGADAYSAIGTYDLSVPFTYFGQTFTSFNISTVGFISFGPPLTDAYDTNNHTVPGTTPPDGTVAIFWDQIGRGTTIGGTDGTIRMERRANYTIISWTGFRIYAWTPSSLNFQIKLFDSGVIEFHYDEMMPGPPNSNSGKETGSSATTWIERPDGSGALPVNINTLGGIQPHTAWRFTPNQ